MSKAKEYLKVSTVEPKYYNNLMVVSIGNAKAALKIQKDEIIEIFKKHNPMRENKTFIQKIEDL